jgi:heterokaryon incompatibility protein (HET)
MGYARTLAVHSGSPACSEFVKQRLSECLHHVDCSEPKITPLPRRIVQLGDSNSDLRVLESTGRHDHYATISYCWGSGETVLKLASDNVNLFTERVPWERIPKTVRDVIDFVRSLNLQYLWIDSLCIIQDSQEDWDTESAKMAEYYQNSFLTLIASSAADADEGVFHDCPLVSPTRCVEWKDINGIKRRIIAQKRNEKVAEYGVLQLSDLGPITRRAWTFQEHALSRRAVHFTDNELIWECPTALIGEDGHKILRHDIQLIQELKYDPHRNPVWTWHSFVNRYSERQLTFQKDRLPAIGGIAERLGGQYNRTYIARLWKETLSFDLVWYVQEYSSQLEDMPSWTWASTRSPVNFAYKHDNNFRFDPKPLLSCQIEVSSGSLLYTKVCYSQLKVTSFLEEFTLDAHGMSVNGRQIQRYTLSGGSQPWSLTFYPDSHMKAVSLSDDPHGPILKRTNQWGGRFIVPVYALWCFLWPVGGPENMEEHWGIVLSKSNLNLPEFVRIGAVRRKVPEGDADLELHSLKGRYITIGQ